MTTTPTSEYLSLYELHKLTDYARCAEQAAWLANKSIPHRVDGKRVIVSREHVKGWLEGRTQQEPIEKKVVQWRDYILQPDALLHVKSETCVEGAGVYALFSQDDDLLYIGKTVSFNRRLNSHYWANKIPYTYFAILEIGRAHV